MPLATQGNPVAGITQVVDDGFGARVDTGVIGPGP